MDHLSLTHIAIAVFFAILFLQSGLDKVFDWKGNLSYLNDHFGKSPLAPFVKQMLGMITLLEVAAGAASAVGAVWIIIGNGTELAQIGLALSALSFLSLFFGQRLAKDYDGAATIASYFTACIVSMYILTLS
jgi:uncharacterized membrane protein YphA (DoxX/SURF4 family)